MIFAKIKLSPSTVPDPFLFDAVMVVTVQHIHNYLKYHH